MEQICVTLTPVSYQNVSVQRMVPRFREKLRTTSLNNAHGKFNVDTIKCSKNHGKKKGRLINYVVENSTFLLVN